MSPLTADIFEYQYQRGVTATPFAVNHGKDPALQVPTILKSYWPGPPPDDLDAPFGPNGAKVAACLTQARAFTRSEIVRLDLRERRDPDLLLAAWDHIRDRLGPDPLRGRRFAVREAAWQAVGEAATRLGIELPVGDGYWRVAQGSGAGAARVTRYLACALVAPTALDAERFEVIADPWRIVIGDVPGAPNSD